MAGLFRDTSCHAGPESALARPPLYRQSRARRQMTPGRPHGAAPESRVRGRQPALGDRRPEFLVTCPIARSAAAESRLEEQRPWRGSAPAGNLMPRAFRFLLPGEEAGAMEAKCRAAVHFDLVLDLRPRDDLIAA